MFKAITRVGFIFAAVFCAMAATFFIWFGWRYGTADAVAPARIVEGAWGIFVLAGFWYLLALAFGLIYWRARSWEE